MLGLSISISNAISGRVSGADVGKALAAAYETRVLADGGVYENSTCLIAALNYLNSI